MTGRIERWAPIGGILFVVLMVGLVTRLGGGSLVEGWTVTYVHDVFVSYRHGGAVRDWVQNHFHPRLVEWLTASAGSDISVFIDTHLRLLRAAVRVGRTRARQVPGQVGTQNSIPRAELPISLLPPSRAHTRNRASPGCTGPRRSGGAAFRAVRARARSSKRSRARGAPITPGHQTAAIRGRPALVAAEAL
jgi:hypothetical protein